MRNAARSGRIDWTAIATFYEQLIRISPTLGARTGYAAAIAEINGADAGLAALDVIAMDGVSGYQPYWAVRAHLLQRLGKTAEALDAYHRAIGLRRGLSRERFPAPQTREFVGVISVTSACSRIAYLLRRRD